MTAPRTSARPRTSRSLVDRVFRNPDTGEVVIWQAPNAPLMVFLGATGARVLVDPDGSAGTAVSVVSGAALAWWSIGEVVRGDSLFRRILGGTVLAGSVVNRLI